MLVALVTSGWVNALLVVLVVLLVQQVEGHILQPLLLGRAVQVHALAVVLAISAGVVVGGIVGALLAVPVVAVLNSAIRSLTAGEDAETPVTGTDPHEAEPPANPESAGNEADAQQASGAGKSTGTGSHRAAHDEGGKSANGGPADSPGPDSDSR